MQVHNTVRSAVSPKWPEVRTPTALWTTQSMKQLALDAFQDAGEEFDEPWHDPEILRELRVDRGLSQSEMAEELDCGTTSISRKLREHGIVKAHKDESTLRELRIERGMTLSEMAEELDSSIPTIRTYIDRYEIGHDHECPSCGETFGSEMGMRTHHTREHDESLTAVEKTCPSCDSVFEVHESDADRRTYCSPECLSDANAERQQGAKNNAWKGGPVTIECKACGGEFTVERQDSHGRVFCSPSCQTSYFSGDKHPNWRGGESIYLGVRRCLGNESWDTTRDRIRRKADYECEWCGEEFPNGRGLPVHHIIPILCGGTNDDELLMALCGSCHNKAEWYTRRLDAVTPALTET